MKLFYEMLLIISEVLWYYLKEWFVGLFKNESNE